MKTVIAILMSLFLVQPATEIESIPTNPCLLCPGSSPNFTLTLKQGSTVIDPANAVVGQTYSIEVDLVGTPCTHCGYSTNAAYSPMSVIGATMGGPRDASCGDQTFTGITITNPNWSIGIAPTARPNGGYIVCLDNIQFIGSSFNETL